jgi:hypothetical protein
MVKAVGRGAKSVLSGQREERRGKGLRDVGFMMEERKEGRC